MKKIFFLSLAFSLSFLSYAQTQPESEVQTEAEAQAQEVAEFFEEFDADFDEMFETAEDTSVAVVIEEPQTQKKKDDNTFPLRFSGHLDSEFGLGYTYQKDETNKPNGYFTFNNYLYMNARPTTETMVKGTFGISFPGYSLGVKEFYFDYIIKNMIYFTAGKKATTWGYTRLFSVSSNATKDKQDEFAEIGAENTNILSDSGNGTSFMFRIPVWTGTITGLGMYSGSSSSPSFDDMKFAGSIEMVIVKTSLNLFGRKETKETGSDKGPLVGFEAKRTFWGADVYGQGLARFDTDGKFKRMFEGSFNKATLQQLVFTGGLYKWWDEKDPAIGFNLEYQGTCKISSSGDEYTGKEIVHRVAFDGGVKRLGPKHNIKVGVELNHNFTDNAGYIKPGVIVSGALPSCDWKSGVKWSYGNSLPASGKWEVGTYLSLALNY